MLSTCTGERLIDLHKLLSLLRIIGDKKGSHTWRTLIAISPCQPNLAPRAATGEQACHADVICRGVPLVGPNDLSLCPPADLAACSLLTPSVVFSTSTLLLLYGEV